MAAIDSRHGNRGDLWRGAAPRHPYAGPYAGLHEVESPRYDGRVGMYRWYGHDPIHFSTSSRWTVGHGQANNFAIATSRSRPGSWCHWRRTGRLPWRRSPGRGWTAMEPR